MKRNKTKLIRGRGQNKSEWAMLQITDKISLCDVEMVRRRTSPNFGVEVDCVEKETPRFLGTGGEDKR